MTNAIADADGDMVNLVRSGVIQFWSLEERWSMVRARQQRDFSEPLDLRKWIPCTSSFLFYIERARQWRS
ncbi:hypothetical protein LOAG_11049 [Loa loa]|uniref:Uncharacterized protein n=1 Tax=Loa loa TaxID=7209 RepID=A0A1S0TNR4_LOALO|nr:hypothetical protein LOAG_11049 [Loa loa]EFO17453.2 hypothetical protein LOAG_11049 [Loa loa]